MRLAGTASVYSTPASSQLIRITQPSGRALATSGPPLRCQYQATVISTFARVSRISVGMHTLCSPRTHSGKPRVPVFRRGIRVYPAAVRKVRPILVSLALALALATVPAAACEPGPGYHTPTNLELAATAPTIVLAQVV